ncbi:M3 family oligoendopeptidase [Halobacteriovorax sp. JY17]|uniref:M3 family oligoendopeptidase n=1 Tax=Halobacteriovorax sp. JY17 TaxID=2014617 RepID=UPI000C37A19B|nr:M3 family oligoendopeptidase [Halobacteriovorax sp. JY17]PIK15032.1 MAG: peptidase family M3 [Halobacteriovorax sp. JY17]
MEIVNDTTVWDNSGIYQSIDDPKIVEDLSTAQDLITSQMKNADLISKALDEQELGSELIEVAREMSKVSTDLSIRLRTIGTYISSILSVDSSNNTAKTLRSNFSKVTASKSKVYSSLSVYLTLIDDETLEAFFTEELEPKRFQIGLMRDFKDHTLDAKRESLINGLSTDGLSAWGKLYNDISGSLVCDVDGKKVNYASAASMTRGGDAKLRESAWRGVQNAWETHEESIAAILNAINGWRLEEATVRSEKKELHYLDISCSQSRIKRETLDALISSTYENRSVGQRAVKSMAKVFGKEKLGPWDLLAPAPSKEGKVISFSEAIDTIEKAFNRLSPEMGAFARMMYEKNWIDARPTEFRKPGAYCTGFANVREPRVFITYSGSMGDLITLAHEIGHAYHSWVMRDLPIDETNYSMTLAETASIFAETLVREYLFDTLESKEEKLEISWQNAESAAAMLCNIPARFEFEKDLVEKRKTQTLTPSEMKSLMSGAWKNWYEDSLSEYDEMFWATKLHFSIAELGFYNYPYLFGYLFSLGVLAQRDKLGEGFNEAYVNLLRDTGRMKAEDLVMKHLGKDISKSEFWFDSLKIVEDQIKVFEELVK